ncbi:MAG: hypothetical protein PUK40_06545 [Actinomycetaceae bacterium]|nr:hypothetical protein [Arcanobacterium sp.]MDD7505582.1 hypothetical protein [Actinomycetaceae bacterium]MDY6143799.1 hypothetical protein [Arcanobacterium sp.]
MANTDYRLVTFRQEAGKVVPGEPDSVSVLTVDFLNSIPQLKESMDGWEPIGFQLVPISPEEILISVMLRIDTMIPDVADMVGW